jgi:hypothetical protein
MTENAAPPVECKRCAGHGTVVVIRLVLMEAWGRVSTALSGKRITCPGCGGSGWVGGACEEDDSDRQSALDLHNATFDRWKRMTDRQRDDEIRRAM